MAQSTFRSKNYPSHHREPLKAMLDITNIQSDSIKTFNPISEQNSFLKNKFFPVPNQSSTPLLRIKAKLVGTSSTQSLDQLVCKPARNSLHHCKSNSDIRRHFPIRGPLSSSSSAKCLNLSLDKSELVDASSIQSNLCRKRSNCSTLSHESSQKCARLTMGADVKYHPRYFRRKSGADSNWDVAHVTATAQLSPVCSIPMPTGFPLQLPLHCSSVKLPWEYVPSCTVETQTSPTHLQLNTSPSSKSRVNRLGRRNSSTTQMFHNLRRKFGHLRRAISADRLNNNTNKSFEAKSTETTNEVERRPVDNVVAWETDPEVQTKCPIYKLTCEVTQKNVDGSIRVSMRRASVSEQFGVFVARDSRGIYVSRIGSVKTAAKLWDVIHVGDRILEVQNVPCDNLEIEDVQNLIRGCELVQFRLKPQKCIRPID